MLDSEWKVSVVIPTHNRSQLLMRAIKSVLNQLYQNIEIIIVDDHSNDDTEKVVTQMMEEDHRIRYYKMRLGESQGGNYARNIGIEHSTGKVIAFLDDDDEWIESKIKLQIEYLIGHPDVKAVSSDLEYVYVINGKEYIMYSNLEINGKQNDFFVSSWLNVTSTIMVYKDVLEVVGGFDQNLPAIQEVELSLRICMNYDVGIIKQPLIRYYQYIADKNQITNNVEKYKTALNIILKKYAKEISELSDTQKHCLQENHLRNIAYRYLRNNQRKDYRKALSEIKNLSAKEKIEYILSFAINYSDMIKLESALSKIKHKIKEGK